MIFVERERARASKSVPRESKSVPRAQKVVSIVLKWVVKGCGGLSRVVSGGSSAALGRLAERGGRGKPLR